MFDMRMPFAGVAAAPLSLELREQRPLVDRATKRNDCDTFGA